MKLFHYPKPDLATSNKDNSFFINHLVNTAHSCAARRMGINFMTGLFLKGKTPINAAWNRTCQKISCGLIHFSTFWNAQKCYNMHLMEVKWNLPLNNNCLGWSIYYSFCIGSHLSSHTSNQTNISGYATLETAFYSWRLFSQHHHIRISGLCPCVALPPQHGLDEPATLCLHQSVWNATICECP